MHFESHKDYFRKKNYIKDKSTTSFLKITCETNRYNNIQKIVVPTNKIKEAQLFHTLRAS